MGRGKRGRGCVQTPFLHPLCLSRRSPFCKEMGGRERCAFPPRGLLFAPRSSREGCEPVPACRPVCTIPARPHFSHATLRTPSRMRDNARAAPERWDA